jgi:photoactive yellow protein
MPDSTPNPDPDDRSVLDSDPSNDGTSSGEDASSSTDAPDTEPSPPAEDASHSSSDERNSSSDNESEQSDEVKSDASDDDPVVEDLHFEDEDLGEKLRHATEEQLDNAPFGIIQVDDEGAIEFYNQYESELSGMDPDEVIGRNFFTQVAPCTNNRLFRGRFKKGVRRGELDETFSYTYTYKMRPTLVDIFLYRDEEGDNWVTVQKY